MRALSTNTVFVRCWATTAESGSWNLTKHTRDDTGKGESLQETEPALRDSREQPTNPKATPGAITPHLELHLSSLIAWSCT